MTRIPEEFFAPPQRGEEPLFEINPASALELVFGVLARTCPDGQALRHPSSEEGPQTIELIPKTRNWNILGLIAHPQEEKIITVEPEPVVTIQLCTDWGDVGCLEYVNEHRVFFFEGKYWASKTPLLIDGAHNNVDTLDTPSALTWKDLEDLTKWIGESEPREVELF